MLEIFTDGGCHGNGTENSTGGFGVVVVENNQLIYSEHGSFTQTTNNQMELFAIQKAMKWLLKNKPNEKAILYSDSSYCIDGCNSWIHKWAKRRWSRGKGSKGIIKNLAQWQDIYRMKAELPFLTFEWVKGHCNNYWNEFVDDLTQNREAKLEKFFFELDQESNLEIEKIVSKSFDLEGALF
jgi:ribonuclease HI